MAYIRSGDFRRFRESTGRTWESAPEPVEEKPGVLGNVVNFFDTYNRNLLSGLEGAIGAGATFVGTQLADLQDSTRRNRAENDRPELHNEFMESIPDKITSLGQWLTEHSGKVNENTRSLDKYANLSLWDRFTTPEYLLDRRGAMADIANQIGYQLPYIAMGEAGVLGKLGKAGGEGVKTISRMAKNAGLDKIGRALGSEYTTEAVKNALQYLPSSVLDAATNSAENYEELRGQGYSNAEIGQKMRASALEELPYDIAAGAMFGDVFSGNLMRRIAGKNPNLVRKIMAAAVPTAVEGTTEGIQEQIQTRTNNKAAGKPYSQTVEDFLFNPTPEERQARDMGAFLSIIPAAGGMGRAYRDAAEMQQESDVKEAWEDYAPLPEDVPSQAASEPPAGGMTKEDFFNAVAGQESGGDYEAENGRTGAFGKYQIMPDNWPSWAEQAGLSADAPMTPENQEIVARYKLGDYYDKYGPEGALVAWYAGEENGKRWADGAPDAIGEGGHYSWDAPQGAGDEPSVREYVQQALGRAEAEPGRVNFASREVQTLARDLIDFDELTDENKDALRAIADEAATKGETEEEKSENARKAEQAKQDEDYKAMFDLDPERATEALLPGNSVFKNDRAIVESLVKQATESKDMKALNKYQSALNDKAQTAAIANEYRQRNMLKPPVKAQEQSAPVIDNTQSAPTNITPQSAYTPAQGKAIIEAGQKAAANIVALMQNSGLREAAPYVATLQQAVANGDVETVAKMLPEDALQQIAGPVGTSFEQPQAEMILQAGNELAQRLRDYGHPDEGLQLAIDRGDVDAVASYLPADVQQSIMQVQPRQNQLSMPYEVQSMIADGRLSVDRLKALPTATRMRAGNNLINIARALNIPMNDKLARGLANGSPVAINTIGQQIREGIIHENQAHENDNGREQTASIDAENQVQHAEPRQNQQSESNEAEAPEVKENPPQEGREKSAQKAEDKKAASEEENIANGKKAIDKILETHGEVKGAMERPEVGAIDFVWGEEGTKAKQNKDGFGIAKILLKHGKKAIEMIPEVIAKGDYEESSAGDRVYFILDGYRAVVRLTWDGRKKTWLVTNFLDKKIKNPDNADAFVRSASTADSTISPSEQGSFSNSTIPQNQQESNTQPQTESRSDGAGSFVERFFSDAGDDARAVAAYSFNENPENPAEGLKAILGYLKMELDSFLEPALDFLKGGMGQGVDIVPYGEDGKGVRLSNNAPWYRDFFAEHKRRPNKAELGQMAREMVAGKSDMEEWTPTDAEMAASMARDGERVAELDRQIAAADAIKDRMKEATKDLKKERQAENRQARLHNAMAHPAHSIVAKKLGAKEKDGQIVFTGKNKEKNERTFWKYLDAVEGEEGTAFSANVGRGQEKSAEEQLAEDEKAWGKALDEWEKNKSGTTHPIEVMRTPLSLQIIGVKDLPIVISPRKLAQIQKDHPEMSKRVLKQIPQSLAEPIMLLKSSTRDGRIIAALELQDESGVNVIIPFELDIDADGIQSNIMTSAYGKGKDGSINYSWYVNQIVNDNVKYWDEEKATKFFESAGVQFSLGSKNQGGFLNPSIKTKDDLVKAQSANTEKRPKIHFSIGGRIPHQVGSGSTQVAGTRSMYVKALAFLRNIKSDIEKVLDYGAGLGLGTDGMRESAPGLQIDSYEPDPSRWKGKEKPTFTDNTAISGKYDAILNTNVLNVVEPEIRNQIVRDIGGLLDKGGVALITTRGWNNDINLNKNYEAAEEPHAMWVVKNINGEKVRVYQKGFDGNELADYVKSVLGDGYTAKKVSGYGKSGVLVKKDGALSANAHNRRLTELTRTIRLIDDEGKLTVQQRSLARFGEEMGVPVVFFRGHPDLHGFHVGGITFLNVDSNMPLNRVFWHETSHWLQANNTILFDDIIKEVAGKEGFTQKQLDAYRESIGRPELSDAETINEMLADALPDVQKRVKIMRQIGKNRSLVERFVSWVQDAMQRFKAWFTENPEAGLTKAQMERMEGAFAKLAANLRDSDGKRVFTVKHEKSGWKIFNSVGAALRPAMGGSFSFAGEKSRTADFSKLKQAQKMAEEGKNRKEIYNATGWIKGVDDRWRYEIPDNLDKIDMTAIRKGPSKLKDVYDNPELYKAYPWLRDVTIMPGRFDEDSYGMAMTGEGNNPGSVVLNSLYFDDSIYELNGEQYFREYSTGEWVHILADGKEEKVKSDAPERFVLTELVMTNGDESKMQSDLEALKAFGASKNMVDSMNKALDMIKSADTVVNINTTPSIEGRRTIVHEIQHLIQKHEGFAVGGSPAGIRQKIKDRIDALKKEGKTSEARKLESVLRSGDTDYNNIMLYQNLAGEQEAREVEARAMENSVPILKESWESRMPTPHTNNAIVIFGGEDVGTVKEEGKSAREGRDAFTLRPVKGEHTPYKWVVKPDGALSSDMQAMAKDYDGVYKTVNGQPGIFFKDLQKATRFMAQAGNVDIGGVSYSVSNNGTPSFTGRIRNIFSGRKAEKQTGRARNAMKAALEQVTGVKIRFGKVDKDVSVIYKELEGVIRSQKAYDWEHILPKCGEIIARKLNIPASDEMHNYIGEWIATGAPNNTSPEATEFAKALHNNPSLRELLLDTQALFLDWQMHEHTPVVFDKEKSKTPIRDLLTRAYDQFVEELGPVERMVKSIMDKSGIKLNASANPVTAFRLYRGSAGTAMNMLEGRGTANVTALQNLFPNVNWSGFKTLQEILDSIGAPADKETYEAFSEYCVACHVMDIHEKNNMLRQEQEYLKQKIDQTDDDAKKAKLQKQIDELEEAIMETPMSEKKCDVIIRANRKRFGKAQQDLVRFSNTTLDILRDSGLISEKRYNELLKAWPNYVPLFREFEDNEDIDFGDSLKHVSGSSRNIIDPIQSIIKNTYEFTRKAAKNKAKCILANLVRVSDVGKYVELVDNASPDDKTTITFYEGGKRKYLQTDSSVAQAINGMRPESVNDFQRLLRLPGQFARAAFTLVNPSFAMRNVCRDAADAYIYSHYGFKPWDVIRGVMHALRKDEVFYEWMAAGGGQVSIVSVDRDYAQSTINKLTKSSMKRFASAHGILDALQLAGEYSEYGTRIAAYERTKKALLKEKKAGYDAMLEAALESRDLMDFARGGKAGRSWNHWAIFSNAAIQGLNKSYRTFAKPFFEGNSKEGTKAWARLVFAGVLPALAFFCWNYDDDKYKELPEWQKQKHWIFCAGDRIIRIPKGQDAMLQFTSNLIEHSLNAVANNGKFEGTRLIYQLTQDLLPSLMPTAILPIIEYWANYSFFADKSIVPGYMQKLPNEKQYKPDTGSLIKMIGEETGLSPLKIEHVLQGYGGPPGMFLISTLPDVINSLAFGGRPLNTSIENAPIISGFMAMPYRNPKSVQDYYDALDEQTKLHNEFKMTHKKPEGYDPALYKRMTSAQTKMRALTKQERAVIADNNLTYDERRERQMKIQEKRIALVKKIMRK